MASPNKAFVLCVASIFLFFSQTTGASEASPPASANSFIPTKYQLIIKDFLPLNSETMVVQCKSKDDDLGYHELNRGDEYSFEFHMSWTDTTVFTCDFLWNFQRRVFNVFDIDVAYKYCGRELYNDCYWEVNVDGFYVGKVRTELQKVYEW